MSNYQARFSEKFVEDFKKLDKPVREIATKGLRKILTTPDKNKRLSGPLAGCLRERFLTYRIIYRINEREGFIEFIRLKKRDEAYR